MVRRLIDTLLSLIAVILFSPLFAIAAIGVLVTSPGPILYRAKRVGLNKRIFTMYKFRTMQIDQTQYHSPVTASNDPRVFAFGSWLRRSKIDELPQLFNILRGEMSIVGPRPEDPEIVAHYYTPAQLETLRILPGLSSPGTIYYYTHCEQLLDKEDGEKYYTERLLPTKLALDMVYVREGSFLYASRIVLRTIWVIFSRALGRRRFPDPPEITKARQLKYQAPVNIYPHSR
ncbi:MAG: hypothetical protein DMG06_05540 [Acidobacteria bacterium]|nr:MAG: hypothetical protein DMG06_05540 [Acidobacteriota bacterium]